MRHYLNCQWLVSQRPDVGLGVATRLHCRHARVAATLAGGYHGYGDGTSAPRPRRRRRHGGRDGAIGRAAGRHGFLGRGCPQLTPQAESPYGFAAIRGPAITARQLLPYLIYNYSCIRATSRLQRQLRRRNNNKNIHRQYTSKGIFYILLQFAPKRKVLFVSFCNVLHSSNFETSKTTSSKFEGKLIIISGNTTCDYCVPNFVTHKQWRTGKTTIVVSRTLCHVFASSRDIRSSASCCRYASAFI